MAGCEKGNRTRFCCNHSVDVGDSALDNDARRALDAAHNSLLPLGLFPLLAACAGDDALAAKNLEAASLAFVNDVEQQVGGILPAESAAEKLVSGQTL